METRHAAELLSAHVRPGSSEPANPDAAQGADPKPGEAARARPAAARQAERHRRAAGPQTAARTPTAGASSDDAARVAARLRDAIGPERFDGSFANKALFRVEAGALEVAAPNKILSGLLERRFGDPLREVVRAELGDCPVRFVVAEVLFGPHTIAPADSQADAAAPAEAPRTAPAPAAKAPPRPQPSERYRLENFIVGDSNRLAHKAALRLAEGEGDATACSPLFIHGPCGVGKTHLLHAAARRFKELHPGAQVRVTGAEAFMNEYVAGVRAGDVEKFRRAYRRVDLLCIDDVHFLSNKQATQGELLHTLNELERSGARIALASDEHPHQIKAFSAALISRFMAGMVAQIQPPDRALREKCVRMFAAQRSLELEPAATEMLVQRTGQLPGQEPASIRDIEGLITRLDALNRLVPDSARRAAGGDQPIGVLMVERALGHAGGSTVLDPGAPVRAARPVRVDAIVSHTCSALAVEHSDLSAKTRHPRVVLARAIITHLARQMTTLSYPEIARAIGRPNHSTVITAFQRLARQLDADEPVDAPGAPEARTLPVLVRQIGLAVQSQAARRPV